MIEQKFGGKSMFVGDMRINCDDEKFNTGEINRVDSRRLRRACSQQNRELSALFRRRVRKNLREMDSGTALGLYDLVGEMHLVIDEMERDVPEMREQIGELRNVVPQACAAILPFQRDSFNEVIQVISSAEMRRRILNEEPQVSFRDCRGKRTRIL
jgi:hypothetical protein